MDVRFRNLLLSCFLFPSNGRLNIFSLSAEKNYYSYLCIETDFVFQLRKENYRTVLWFWVEVFVSQHANHYQVLSFFYENDSLMLFITHTSLFQSASLKKYIYAYCMHIWILYVWKNLILFESRKKSEMCRI